MASVASLIAKGVIAPPVAPALAGQFDPSVLLGPSYATMREALGLQTAFHMHTGESVAAATKMLGEAFGSRAVFGEIDTQVKFLANQQNSTIAAAEKAIAALTGQQARSISGITAGIVAAGIGSTVAAIKGVADSQAALMGMQSGFGRWADSITHMTQDIARFGALGSASIPYPIPAIHIRRAPALLPPMEETPLIIPERRRRRLGRPRGSYQCSPELVLSTYKRLAEAGRYVTQERLAYALDIDLRTLQKYLSPRGMDLGWPLKF